jgi:AraC-like DNA-binding protein
MEKRDALYEPAAARGDGPRPLLHLSSTCTFWAGPTATRLAEHEGGAPVFLAGLHGKFGLRLRGGDWLHCRAAIVPPGIGHELDFAGEPFTALYAEPILGGLGALTPLLRDARELNGILIGRSAEIPLLRLLHEDASSEDWVGEALHDVLGISWRGAGRGSIDPRLSAVVDLLHRRCDDLDPVVALARSVGLSASRFQHLFTRQVGVPFRRYRAWNRLRMAWLEIARGSTCTAAAHLSGFFDSAHFSRDYRRTFGIAASKGLRRSVRVSAAMPRD